MDIFSRKFFDATMERAVKTFCQTLLAVLVAVGTPTVTGVGWWEALGTAVMASILSVLTSVASSGTGGDAGPSLNGIEQLERGDG